MLFHCYFRGFICPDKTYGKKTIINEDDEGGAVATKKGRRKPQYAGGLVLEPKKGIRY